MRFCFFFRKNEWFPNTETIGCLATWCPCILYGKTQARRDGNPEASCCNGSVSHIFIGCTDHALLTCVLNCMGWCALSLCQFQRISQMITRSKLRHQHDIKGNGCTDCLISAFCGCCALVQEEKEVKEEEGDKKHIAPKQQPPMVYVRQ